MAKIVTLKITVEHGTKTTVTRVKCYSGQALQEARQHARSMAPTGSTVIFEER